MRNATHTHPTLCTLDRIALQAAFHQHAGLLDTGWLRTGYVCCFALSVFGCANPGTKTLASHGAVHSAPPDPALLLDPRAPDPPAAASSAAPPHPKVQQLLAQLRQAKDAGAGDPSTVGEAMCRRWTGSKVTDLQGCELQLLGNGTAAQVVISHDCGQHSCSVEAYTWYGTAGDAWVATAAATDVTPDHRFLLYDDFEYNDASVSLVRGYTLRFDRTAGTRERHLGCFSARLSPQGRYYVCRDLKGNVLKVPIRGGRTEIVVRAKLPPDEVIKLGGPFFDYPAQVKFVSAHELEYDLYLQNRESYTTHRAPFRE